MRILISIGSFHPGHGGPFFSVGNLAKHLAAAGHAVRILTADYPHLPVQNVPDGIELHSIKASLLPFIRQSWIPGCRDWLEKEFDDFRPDIVHDNGLWLTLNNQIARVAETRNIPLVLSPRGCLDPWAMRYRGWKKKLALQFFQRKTLDSVTCYHAASGLEVKSITGMGIKCPVAVIPNGVELIIRDSDRDRNAPQGNRFALFMGRLHPVKNLESLLKAWALVQPAGWILRLVGSDEVGYRAEMEDLAAELNILDQIQFLGPVYGDEKEDLFRTSSLAFLVSHSENFGVAAAEALTAGIPVIASHTTPWSCLEEETMGWWVPGSVEGIAAALEHATSLEPSAESMMRRNAMEYAANTFGWPAIAETFTQLYKWVADMETIQPEFVH